MENIIKNRVLSQKINKKRLPSSERRIYIALFCFAIAIRGIYIFQLHNTPFEEMLLGDSQKFDLWAQEIAGGNWIGTGVFFHAPLYPYLLGFIYTVFGRSLLLVKLLQAFLGGLSCLFIAETGRTFVGRNVGLLAGFLAALCPTAIFYDGMIHKASLGFFCTTLLLYLMSKHYRTPKFSWMALSGLTLGALILLRQNTILFAAIILPWIAFSVPRTSWRLRLAWMGCFLACICVILFPVAIRNKIVGGEFVLTTSNFGMNFYIGNNADADGTYAPLRWGRGDWSFEHEDVGKLAENAVGRPLKASEVSSYWARQAFDDIMSNPLQWLKLLGKKWLLTWGAIEIGDSESIYAHEEWSAVIKLLNRVLHYGILVPLAAVGLWAGWPLRKTIWPLYLMLLGYAFSITMIFVFARYRHPMTTIVLLFSATGISCLAVAVRQKRYVALVISGLIMAIVIPMTNQEIFTKNNIIATTYYNVASTFDREGRLPEAIGFYHRCLNHNPRHVMGMNNLAIALFKSGETEASRTLLEDALKIDANRPEVYNNLAIVAAAQRQYQIAGEHFHKVIELNPEYNPSVYYNLACIYALSHDIEAAMDWLEKALSKGYHNWHAIQTDPDLANIRFSDRYRALLERHAKRY